MRIFKYILSIVITTVSFVSAFAQELECKAEENFSEIQCDMNSENEKCIIISVLSDSQGKEFEYEWELGDGTILMGQKIEHCYEELAVYDIKLNLIDPDTKFKFNEELIKTIDLLYTENLEIISPGEVTQGKNTTFNYEMQKGDFNTNEIYWAFGDGNFSCEENPTHSYQESGKMEIKLLIKGLKFGMPFDRCINKIVKVKTFILDGEQLNDIFSNKEKELSNRGRFLNDDVHYIIYEKNNPSLYQVFDIDDDKYTLSIDPDKEYEMYAWKGNLFTPIQGVSTLGLTEEQAEKELRKSITALFDKEPENIDGFKFGNEEYSIEGNKIKNIATLLNKYEHVNIAIGVYTHTGGRIDRNLSLSKSRAEFIKDELIAEGVKPNRIVVVTAKEQYSLLNTCGSLINCDLEDESLNRKAEFLVTGIQN